MALKRSVVQDVSRDLLRLAIIEEERLRLAIARDDAFRAESPEVWRRVEIARRAENRNVAAINRRLRALGLTPMRLSPSLGRRRQELRRLQARNAAIIAARGADPSESGEKSRGTKLAGSRRRRA
jgi:hypothetical protein